jgi:hypothetical protein
MTIHNRLWTLVEQTPPLVYRRRFVVHRAYDDERTSGIGWIWRGVPTSFIRARHRADKLNQLMRP